MKTEYKQLSIVFALILTVTFSFIIFNQWPLLFGKRIILATQPVDPFDPFRGQYMAINYEISTIDDAYEFAVKDDVYIILEADDRGIWRKIGISKTKPRSVDFIKGEIIYINDGSATAEYGIEQYFFERNADLPTENITIEAAVDRSGRSKLVQMLHNGRPITIDYEKFDIRS